IDRFAPRACAVSELSHAGGIVNPRATRTDGLLKTKQKTVQIDRDDLGGVDGLQGLAIGKPARAEVPAAFGRRPYVAIQLRRDTPAALGERRVFAIGLIARRVGIVPIAVERGTIGHENDAAMGRASS